MAKSEVTFEEFARTVVDTLEVVGLEYLIGGAVAVAAWGEVRTTRDFDVVINLPGDQIVRFSQELAKRGMLVPPEVMIDLLLQSEGDLPINALHLHSSYKAELFLLRSGDEFRRVALARRRLVNFEPPMGEVYVHAPEDLILNKVHYYGLSQQPKHIRDIASILVFMEDQLDFTYIDEWAQKLELTPIWFEVLGQVDELLGLGDEPESSVK
ncbi:MAG: hypothetical protein R3C14_51170 [Caldilineaceae bacterium]